MQFGIPLSQIQKSLMGSALNNLSFFKKKDFICTHDTDHLMGDDNAGTVIMTGYYRIMNASFSFFRLYTSDAAYYFLGVVIAAHSSNIYNIYRLHLLNVRTH